MVRKNVVYAYCAITMRHSLFQLSTIMLKLNSTIITHVNDYYFKDYKLFCHYLTKTICINLHNEKFLF
ncbi:unnamed protein product [Brugia timori]|uniref:Uncharacterized protein n=1 Tax=Brugia timori TaxID=42155 RepID=A0A3P7VXX2_9BILA|nr:unnamed protein product [Brugia timori]